MPVESGSGPTLAAVAALCVAATPVAPQVDFVPDRFYPDTVAVGGDAFEASPLLIFRQAIHSQLVDSTTVVYADQGGGNLTLVDLVTRQGWQVLDDGLDGPGEFGGTIPFVSATDSRIHTSTIRGASAIRSLGGELLEARRYRDFEFRVGSQVQGILREGILISLERTEVDWRETEPQTISRSILARSVEDPEVWRYFDLPSSQIRVVPQGDGRFHTVSVGEDPGIVVAARHETVVLAGGRQRWVRVLGLDGRVRAEVELPHDVYRLFIDAEERVWVQVWARNERRTGSYVVLDRDLNVLFRVAEGSVQDAFGPYLLTIDLDDNELMRLYLLREAGG